MFGKASYFVSLYVLVAAISKPYALASFLFLSDITLFSNICTIILSIVQWEYLHSLLTLQTMPSQV